MPRVKVHWLARRDSKTGQDVLLRISASHRPEVLISPLIYESNQSQENNPSAVLVGFAQDWAGDGCGSRAMSPDHEYHELAGTLEQDGIRRPSDYSD